LVQANGVACVRASTLFSAEILGIAESIVAGTVHVVINIPKQAVKNVLPTMAGLKILQPSPPKTIFPIAIEKTLPITAAQMGRLGGTDSASIMPVTTALKSPSELGFLRIALQSHSVTTEQITQVDISMNAWMRKYQPAAIIAGARPIITSIITDRVESGLLICGACETVMFSSIYPYTYPKKCHIIPAFFSSVLQERFSLF
jgi:hypothetical protein